MFSSTRLYSVAILAIIVRVGAVPVRQYIYDESNPENPFNLAQGEECDDECNRQLLQIQTDIGFDFKSKPPYYDDARYNKPSNWWTQYNQEFVGNPDVPYGYAHGPAFAKVETGGSFETTDANGNVIASSELENKSKPEDESEKEDSDPKNQVESIPQPLVDENDSGLALPEDSDVYGDILDDDSKEAFKKLLESVAEEKNNE